jgi:hypothetical protein
MNSRRALQAAIWIALGRGSHRASWPVELPPEVVVPVSEKARLHSTASERSQPAVKTMRAKPLLGYLYDLRWLPGWLQVSISPRLGVFITIQVFRKTASTWLPQMMS